MYKRISRVVLVVISLLTLLALTQFPNLRFSYDFESFFPVDDDDLVFYNQFREEFTPDNDFILLGIENNGGIFDTAFLKEVDQMTHQLSELPFVASVNSPTQQKEVRMGPFGPFVFDLLHIKDPVKLKMDSSRIVKDGTWINRLFAENGNSMLVYLTTEPGLSKVKSDRVVVEIDSVLAQHSFDKLYKSGRVYGQKYYVERMQNELGIFVLLSVFMLALFLTFSFRTVWGVIVPLTVVMLTVIWQLGIMSAIGQPLDILSMLLPTILFVVGISDVVHIINRYLEELRLGKEKTHAVLIAFKQVGLATFLTSLTTAIGFLTLVSADIVPIKDFGWQTAMGVWLAFILAFTFLPSILILLPTPKIAQKDASNPFWNKVMVRTFRLVLHSNRWIVFGGALFTSVALVGISFIKVDNYLLEDLSEDDPYRKNFEYFENNYSGVRPFELIVIDTTNNNVFSFENLHALDRIEHSIYQNYPVKVVESPLFFVKFLNQISNGNDKAFFKIPETKSEFLKLQKYMKGARFRKAMDSFISEDKKQLRFSCRMKDLGGNEMGKRNEKLLSCVAQLENEHLEVKLTGMSLLIDKNNETLAAGMMESLLVAFGIIAILMGWLFRSVQMVLITLIPNILPLVGIAGVMGFSGIDLKVSTSIIFTIAFGIAVDDTIHYVSKLKVLLNNGRSLPYAMKRTGISTGKAIVVTSLILISGFVTLIFSTFASTFYIGLLVSITLFLAIVFDLLLLPSLIIVFYKKRSK